MSSKEAGLIVALHNQVRARVARGEEKRGRSLLPLLIKKGPFDFIQYNFFPKNETLTGEAGGFSPLLIKKGTI